MVFSLNELKVRQTPSSLRKKEFMARYESIQLIVNGKQKRV